MLLAKGFGEGDAILWRVCMDTLKKMGRHRYGICVPVASQDLLIDWQQCTQLLIDFIKESFQESVTSLSR